MYNGMNQFNNNGNFNQMGFGYGAKPAAKFTQPVTPEMSRMIHQEEDQLDVKISKIDSIKNQCTHKEPGTGNMAIVANADNTVTCRTCGETFHLIAPEEADGVIKDAVEKVVDTMQSLKLFYVDAPVEFVKEYFQCITLLKKLPAIYKKGAANFSSYEVYSGNAYPVYNGWNNHQSAFTAFNNMMSVNPFMGTPGQTTNPGFVDPRYGYNGGNQPMYQQPTQGYPMQNPTMAPAPQQGYNPAMAPQQMGNMTPGFTQAGYVNPTAPQQPIAGYQATPPAPVNGAPNGNPMAYGVPNSTPVEAAPASITSPANQDEIQQTKTMSI